MSNPLILEDSSTQLWSITVDDNGLLYSTAVGSGTVVTLILNDPANASTWQFGITTGGLLTTTSLTLSPIYPTSFTLTSMTGRTLWNLGVTSGGLMTTTFVDNLSPVAGGTNIVMGRMETRPRSDFIG